ncbi:MAG TPA: hypothetical protein VD706_00185 [Candidatus Saccharimonadales bacterium]|nr:hypothetical protein [Candidatus Saccharimonadales bacterium]
MTTIPAIKELQPHIVAIATGTDDMLVRQLIEKSKQPNILKYTPNDAGKRFKDAESFKTWQTGGREIHWLLGPDNDLAGILWYGKKLFPLADIRLNELPEETLAIRLYDGYTGHGLARPAMQQSLALHVQTKQQNNEPVIGLWLQTDCGNAAAIATYTKFGYKEVARDGKRVTMILSADEVKRKGGDAL